MSGLNRLRNVLEAGLVGLFLIQALRAAIALVYGRVASASIYPAIDLTLVDPVTAGLISPAVVRGEMILLAAGLALPLLTLFFGRWRGTLFLMGLAVAGARLVMVAPSDSLSPLVGASLVIGTGLGYIACVVRHRLTHLPYLFVIGFTADQILRAAGNTLDVSLGAAYLPVQVALSVVLVVFVILNSARPVKLSTEESRGLFTLWGGVGMGALLFLQLALLASPNAAAGRASFEYTPLVPALIVATALPLIPWVRDAARGFVGLFDTGAQGWVWLLLLALMIVVGTRVQGVVGGSALVVAQALASLSWWWLVRPQAEKERNFSGLWMIGAVVVFALLVACDLFTYEYAYVREFAGQAAFLNRVVTPLLRGFRGLGLAVLILAVVLASLPVVASRRSGAWSRGSGLQSLFGVLTVTAAALLGLYFARPPVIVPVRDAPEIRVASYNIHSGYSEFYHYDLEALARTIQESGANVVLLQEVEGGRLTSYGADQALWLARRLRMDRRFFPTNEGLHGLAVLSNIEITVSDGMLLTSRGLQTGVQRVKIRPDEGEISLYNTWLGVLLEGVGVGGVQDQEQDQQRQLNEVLSLMLAHGGGTNLTALGRFVLGGTFNNVPCSDMIQRLTLQPSCGASSLNLGDARPMIDPFADENPVNATTFRQVGRSARLDYVFTNMLALGRLVLETPASDHRLAVVGLNLAR